MKVLVVDDDVVSRMLLMHLIDSVGPFDILEAEDGADAWQQLDDGARPALCFCDLRMPRLSGMQLLERIKADPRLAAMRFVLVSSANDRATMLAASGAGAAGYIIKPFQAGEVRGHLETCLEQAVPAADSDAAAPVPAAATAARCESPKASQQRLGISAERLLHYLAALARQLTAAGADIEALLAHGEHADAQLRIERLQVACLTLGLNQAAASLGERVAGAWSWPVLQGVLADIGHDIAAQSGLVRSQDQAGT